MGVALPPPDTRTPLCFLRPYICPWVFSTLLLRKSTPTSPGACGLLGLTVDFSQVIIGSRICHLHQGGKNAALARASPSPRPQEDSGREEALLASGLHKQLVFNLEKGMLEAKAPTATKGQLGQAHWPRCISQGFKSQNLKGSWHGGCQPHWRSSAETCREAVCTAIGPGVCWALSLSV